MNKIDRLLDLKIQSLTKETLKEFNDLKLKYEQSLKLQELVKERIKEEVKLVEHCNKQSQKKTINGSALPAHRLTLLQSLVEESEKIIEDKK